MFFYSVDTNVITRAACYTQITGLGECIGATRWAHLCHDAIKKVTEVAAEKPARIISSQVIEECGNNIDEIIEENFDAFISMPEKKEKVARLQNKMREYDVMSHYKDRCLYKLRSLKGKFTRIQYDQVPAFVRTRDKIAQAIQTLLDDHDSAGEISKRLHNVAATLKITSEEYRQTQQKAIRMAYESDFAQILHHQQSPIQPADLHVLADLYLHLQAHLGSPPSSCILLTMDRHFRPFLGGDLKTVISGQITQIFEDQLKIKCLHPGQYLQL